MRRQIRIRPRLRCSPFRILQILQRNKQQFKQCARKTTPTCSTKEELTTFLDEPASDELGTSRIGGACPSSPSPSLSQSTSSPPSLSLTQSYTPPRTTTKPSLKTTPKTHTDHTTNKKRSVAINAPFRSGDLSGKRFRRDSIRPHCRVPATSAPNPRSGGAPAAAAAAAAARVSSLDRSLDDDDAKTEGNMGGSAHYYYSLRFALIGPRKSKGSAVISPLSPLPLPPLSPPPQCRRFQGEKGRGVGSNSLQPR